MKVEHFKNCSLTIYDEAETAFIETLPIAAQKNIHRGIAIPSDYGYKPECIYFKIDGTKVTGTQLSRDEFIKKFKELENMLMDDAHEYYVIYEEENAFPWSIGQYKEYFWCIPTSEITFKPDPEGGWILVGRIDNEEEYNKKVELFDLFEARFAHYVLFDHRADETIFKVWQSFQKWLTTPTDADVISDNKYCFLKWVEEYWGAWYNCIMDVTNEQYKYMNLTQLVWESWEEV